MITAESITDEQIRELREAAIREYLDTYNAAVRALAGDVESRARCAEILNARTGATS